MVHLGGGLISGRSYFPKVAQVQSKERMELATWRVSTTTYQIGLILQEERGHWSTTPNLSQFTDPQRKIHTKPAAEPYVLSPVFNFKMHKALIDLWIAPNEMVHRE